LCAGIELFGELLLNRKELEVTNEERVRAMKAEELLADYDRIMLARALGKATDASITWHYELRSELLSRLSRVEELQAEVQKHQMGESYELGYQRGTDAAAKRVEELQQQVAAIAEAVSRFPTITGLQQGCVKDHSLIRMAIIDAQQAYADTLKRHLRDANQWKSRAEAAEGEAEKAKEERNRLEKMLQDIYAKCVDIGILKPAALTPEPAQSTPQQQITPQKRSCNRHEDCDTAEEALLARSPSKTKADISLSFHCHAEDCEDCFGS